MNQICIFFAAALQPKPSMPVQREGGETRGKEQKPSLPDAGEGKATLPSYWLLRWAVRSWPQGARKVRLYHLMLFVGEARSTDFGAPAPLSLHLTQDQEHVHSTIHQLKPRLCISDPFINQTTVLQSSSTLNEWNLRQWEHYSNFFVSFHLWFNMAQI